ncbi:MAG: hypothetical protein PHP13_02885 [Methanomicrobium sp.]|nr:hypothetical protein [Methanomicrobium sp.]MDD4300138.1 hypothetical protein [Methanomicrobium sp.]
MIKERAVDAVSRILEAASYDVDEGAGGIDLTAYRGNECLVALCSDEMSDIEFFARKKFKVALDDGVAECKKLLFTMKSIAGIENCTIWGHSELAKYAGQATVAEILGQTLALDFSSVNSAGGFLEKSFSSSVQDEPGPELLCMPQSVSEERARQIAGVKGELKRVFIPHFLYTCESTGEKVFNTHVIDFRYQEKGLINAISGSRLEMESEDLDKVTPERKNVAGSAKILDAKLKKNDLRDSIRERVAGELTKKVRVSKSEGDAISYEDVKVAPDAENIKVELELVYMPVIQIRGDRIIEIEAFSGEILREPLDDGVELL